MGRCVGFPDNDGAGTAVTLRATLLGASQSTVAHKVEKGDVRIRSLQINEFTVEEERH